MFLPVFTDCPAAVIHFIENSRRYILIAVCWFTHPLIFQALKKAGERGVKIRLVVNYDQINFSSQGLDFQCLTKIGATMRAYPGPQLMHHKMAVSDGQKVLTGSFNWTGSDQIDHLIVIESAPLTIPFEKAFDQLWGMSRSLERLGEIPMQHVVFTALNRVILRSAHDIKKRVISRAKCWIVTFASEDEWSAAVLKNYCRLDLKKGLTLPAIYSTDAMKTWMNASTLPAVTRQELTRFCLHANAGDVVVAVSPCKKLLGIGLLGNAQFTTERESIFRYAQWLTCRNPDDHPIEEIPCNSSFTKFKGSVLALLPAL